MIVKKDKCLSRGCDYTSFFSSRTTYVTYVLEWIYLLFSSSHLDKQGDWIVKVGPNVSLYLAQSINYKARIPKVVLLAIL